MRIVLRETSSGSLDADTGLCERPCSAGWSQDLLSDYLVKVLGGAGFLNRHDVSDFKESRPVACRGREAVFRKKTKPAQDRTFHLAFASGKL